MRPGESMCHRAYAVHQSGKSGRQQQAGMTEVAGVGTALRLSCHTLALGVNSEHHFLAAGAIALCFYSTKENANMHFFLGMKQRVFSS